MSSILKRNQKIAPQKKTRQEHAEDALYREVWEEVNNEKTIKFIKKYQRHMLAGALVVLIIATGFQIGVRHINNTRIQTAERYEAAVQTVDANTLAQFANDASGATSDLALFQAYLIDKDINKLNQLATDGHTRDFRDLAKLHIVSIQGDEMTSDQVKEMLSDMDTKSSPFYYTAILTMAQKYLADDNRELANKLLDKIINDADAPASIVSTATTLK